MILNHVGKFFERKQFSGSWVAQALRPAGPGLNPASLFPACLRELPQRRGASQRGNGGKNCKKTASCLPSNKNKRKNFWLKINDLTSVGEKTNDLDETTWRTMAAVIVIADL
jgi:hypothetical protein